jgi:hypothetical protein
MFDDIPQKVFYLVLKVAYYLLSASSKLPMVKFTLLGERREIGINFNYHLLLLSL